MLLGHVWTISYAPIYCSRYNIFYLHTKNNNIENTNTSTQIQINET